MRSRLVKGGGRGMLVRGKESRGDRRRGGLTLRIKDQNTHKPREGRTTTASEPLS